MLDCLHIENIAVVELSDITFSDGFNVLTGETGAGKSIIIDSLNAVLGARTSKELIRNGCKTANVSAQFSKIGNDAKIALKEAGFSNDENGILIISRVMNLDGKNTFRINGAPTTAAVIREIGKYLVNIHGQHDNQSLLNPESHRVYIDKLAENNNFFNAYSAEFKNLLSIRKELKALEIDEVEKQRTLDILNYQINELEAADIREGEYDELKEKSRLAQNFEKNYKALSSANQLIKGDDADGILEMLRETLKKIEIVDTEKVKRLYSKFSEVFENLNDAASDLQDYIDNEINLDYDIEKIGDRMALLQGIMRKYGGTEKSAIEFLENAKHEFEKIKFSDERIKELEVLFEQSEQRLVLCGEKLTASRKTAAAKFEKDVTDSLKFLDMPNVRFEVDFKSGKYTKFGCDIIEFMISANAGEDLKPLNKIVSGGELSRTMLAIKSILAGRDEVGTLIFAEIDTGIRGHAATKVANKLKSVSKTKQVICVTHLAQIAAFSANHMLIEKNTRDGRTYTTVDSLDYNGRITELARIMTGTDLTKTMYDSAKELLDRSFNNENL